MKRSFAKKFLVVGVGAIVAMAVGCSVVNDPVVVAPHAATASLAPHPACSTQPGERDPSTYPEAVDPLFRAGPASKAALKAADAAKATPSPALAQTTDETRAAQAAFLTEAAKLRSLHADDARYEKARADLKATMLAK